MQKIRTADAVEYIADRVPFRSHGALRATAWATGGTGRLASRWHPWLAEQDGRHIDYVLWSYATPIAWHMTYLGCNGLPVSTWIVPSDRYSVTTTRHQGLALRAVAEDAASFVVTDADADWPMGSPFLATHIANRAGLGALGGAA